METQQNLKWEERELWFIFTSLKKPCSYWEGNRMEWGSSGLRSWVAAVATQERGPECSGGKAHKQHAPGAQLLLQTLPALSAQPTNSWNFCYSLWKATALRYNGASHIFQAVVWILPARLLFLHPDCPLKSAVELFSFPTPGLKASQMVQWQRICLTMQEMWVPSLGREDPLEKEMATHFSILAWEIPWTE